MSRRAPRTWPCDCAAGFTSWPLARGQYLVHCRVCGTVAWYDAQGQVIKRFECEVYERLLQDVYRKRGYGAKQEALGLRLLEKPEGKGE